MKMEEWKECKLGEFFELHRGYDLTKSEIKEGPYPVVCSTSIMGYHNEYKVKAPGVVIGRSGTLGEVQFIDTDYWPHNTSLYVSDFKGNSPKFIKYFLQLFGTGNVGGGSAVPTLNRNHLQALTVRVPPLPTQQKIAAILSSLDDKIELNNKINTNLEQQAQALFKNWFVDFEPFGGKMPEGWKVGKLSDIADYLNGYAFSSKELLNEPGENCLDVFKQGHIKKGGGFIPDGTKSWYPLSKCQKLKNYILKKGDILMAMTDMKGNVAILGNTAIMPVDDKYIVNQRVGLLRAKKELNIDYPYLYLLTNDQDFLMDLRSRANSGVQVNLSSTAIKESEVNIAPKEVYKQFNDIILPLFEKILANQQENQKLSQIRDGLLPKLMNGEIEI